MKKRSLYLFMLSFLVALAACKKEDKTDKEKQFIGTWQQVSVEESVNGGDWTENTDQCDLQEIVAIDGDSDHSLSLYSNEPSQCGDQTYYGRWDIFDEGKTMIWNIDGIVEPLDKEVVKIDGSTLITIHDVHTVTPTRMRITYKKR